MGQIDLLALDVQPGDRLLLCSDGLTEELPDYIITPILSSNKDSQTIAEELLDTAKDKGGRDNITVLIVNCGS
jgi:Serine/threonine protein phosphatase